MSQFEIARLDEDGVIIAVEAVSEADHRTDAVARTVRLDGSHDMRNRLKIYKWNFNKHQFEPLSTEPLEVAERDTSELVEALIETVEDIAAHLADSGRGTGRLAKAGGGGEDSGSQFNLSKRMERVLNEYRRRQPRRDKLK